MATVMALPVNAVSLSSLKSTTQLHADVTGDPLRQQERGNALVVVSVFKCYVVKSPPSRNENVMKLASYGIGSYSKLLIFI